MEDTKNIISTIQEIDGQQIHYLSAGSGKTVDYFLHLLRILK